MILRILLMALPILGLASCSSISPVCQPKAGKSAGFSAASRGEAPNPTLAAGCKDEQAAQFRASYQKGYEDGKRHYCSPNQLHQLGFSRGEKGLDAQSIARLCQAPSALTEYKKGYTEGLESYCAIESVGKLGFQYGRQGKAQKFPKENYQICKGTASLKSLRSAFHKDQNNGLKQYCSGSNVAVYGINDGMLRKPPRDIEREYEVCGKARAKELTVIYRTRYDEARHEDATAKGGQNSPSHHR